MRERYLLTRMMADELRLFVSVLGRPPRPSLASMVGLVGEVRDPVCGRAVDLKAALTAEYGGRTYYFVSAESRDQFLGDPERFRRAQPNDNAAG